MILHKHIDQVEQDHEPNPHDNAQADLSNEPCRLYLCPRWSPAGILFPTTETQDEVEGGFLLNVVVGQSAAVFGSSAAMRNILLVLAPLADGDTYYVRPLVEPRLYFRRCISTSAALTTCCSRSTFFVALD